MNQMTFQIGAFAVFIVFMYFILIRPQKKRDKKIKDMRNSIRVGDEVVTIGGICGKIVKTKEDSLIIRVGADRVKFEIKRWAVSSVENRSSAKPQAKQEFDAGVTSDASNTEGKKPKRFKRLKKEENDTNQATETVNEEPAKTDEIAKDTDAKDASVEAE